MICLELPPSPSPSSSPPPSFATRTMAGGLSLGDGRAGCVVLLVAHAGVEGSRKKAAAPACSSLAHNPGKAQAKFGERKTHLSIKFCLWNVLERYVKLPLSAAAESEKTTTSEDDEQWHLHLNTQSEFTKPPPPAPRFDSRPTLRIPLPLSPFLYASTLCCRRPLLPFS